MSHGAHIIMITSFPAGFQWVSWLPTQIKTGCSDITKISENGIASKYKNFYIVLSKLSTH